MSIIKIISTIFLLISSTHTYTKTFSIMLDPAGDAKNTGRVIDNSFERTLSLQYAQELKKIIESAVPQVRIILTRSPEEIIDPLQNANFANRLAVDFYLSIHFFYEPEQNPTVYLYHFTYNPVTELWINPKKLCFYPYNQAHLFNIHKTVLWAEQIKATLKQDKFRPFFEVNGVYGIPFRPLAGIKAPALALEAGLKNKNDWRRYLEPVAQSLIQLIQTGIIINE
jgi:N-acetylmuramoyl-L-alanine amidase